MEIKIFDVEHGFCAYIVADNGNVILIDCGHNEQTGFRPSNYLQSHGCTGIERFIVSNYDEDHLSDLPYLRRLLPIQVLHRNRSINADELHRLKLRDGPIQPGMQSLLDMIRTYSADVINPPEFPGIEMAFFCNRYPTFEDTNNLSLVTFLNYYGIKIIFPGDLERSGWLSLLQNQSFREHLSGVNIFVAPHHGRESGYCAEVFDYCHPDLIVISDESIQYETQITNYSRLANGVYIGNSRRYVLSTRNDGMITIYKRQGDIPWITPER